MTETPEPTWTARAPLTVGILALVTLVGGLGGWSVGTTLSGAIIAEATVEVESNRQVVQHPDGGVVQRLLARDGDMVAAGELLLRLDDTRARSELAVVEGQLRELAARRARLRAERAGAAEIAFPPDLLALAARDAEVRAQVEGERALFVARTETLAQQIELLGQQNAQIASRIEGIEAELAALERQGALIARDLVDQRQLLEQRLTQASRVSSLERDAAGIDGQIGRLRAEIAELQGQITANEIAALQAATQRREEATGAERDLQFSEIELAERRITLLDRLSRTELRAPVSGIVYDAQIFAEQTVIQPAEPLLYIVPQDQPLVVAAKVNAIDIAEVHIGQEVSMRFVAFDQQGRLPAEGRVVRVSADAITDEQSGAPYYAVDIRPEAAALEDLRAGEELLPGMPVQAFLKTRDRTALAYLIEPFGAFFERTFRE